MNSEKLGLNGFEKTLIVIIPILMAVIFYYLPSVVHWIEMMPFLSDNQLINFITGIESSWLNRGLGAVGFISGVFLSIFIYTEILKMEVNRDYVVVDIFDKKSEIQKLDIQCVFKEEKKLVIIGHDGFEILRQDTDYSTEKLQNAFQKFHYPWVSEDPYINEFFKWTAGHDELSETANTILYERRLAKRDDDENKVKDLRHDLMELGVIVKDCNNAQFVRLVTH